MREEQNEAREMDGKKERQRNRRERKRDTGRKENIVCGKDKDRILRKKKCGKGNR